MVPVSIGSCARFVAVLLPAVVLAACSVTPPQEINEKYREVLESLHDQYRIQDGDTINVRLYGLVETQLDQPNLFVLPDGRSDAFFLDNHRFAGKTVPEVEKELRAAMEKEIDLTGIEISVQVTPRQDVIYLVGEFMRPTSIPFKTNLTLGEAIASAGGLRITGDTDYALLRRPYLDPRKPDKFRIDLNDDSEEIFLLPGDQIILSKNFLASVVEYLREYIFGVIPSGLYYRAFFGI